VPATKNKINNMENQVGYFKCGKNELERLNEGLKSRNLSTDSILSITDNIDHVTVYYKQ
jgi:hypothetical protein